MKSLQKKFYITTAIDYVNGKPHIGHALEKTQADVLARYHRLQGHEVFFLTGTDEHGATNVRGAEKAGKNVRQFVDENAGYFRDLKKVFNLSWDAFIRTSDKERHWPGAQKLWKELHEAGDLYRKNYSGLYCIGHEAFITEKDLADGKCVLHQKEPEVIEEEDWFFRLSKYTKEIEARIKKGEIKIVPETRQNEILSLLKEGLEDVSFSRPRKDLSWGVPVPNDPDSTMYVWCDALTNYITALGYGGAESQTLFDRFWPADAHLIGKDILRFHAAIWPGMLLSAGLPLPKQILVHGFITVDGQKMSKTIGNVVDPVELVEKYGTDPVRYFLLREIPSGGDGDFSYKKFEERYNGDLANGLGNLVARVVTLADKLKVKNETLKITIKNSKFETELIEIKENYNRAIEEFRLNEALEHIWKLIKAADVYINDEKPWEQEKPEVIADLLLLILAITKLLEPFMPQTAQKIGKQIRVEDGEFVIEKRGNLFPRL